MIRAAAFPRNAVYASLSAGFAQYAVPLVYKRKSLAGMTNSELAHIWFIPTDTSIEGLSQFLSGHVQVLFFIFLIVSSLYIFARRFFASPHETVQAVLWGAFVGAYLFLALDYNFYGELSRSRESLLQAYGLVGVLDNATWFLLFWYSCRFHQ